VAQFAAAPPPWQVYAHLRTALGCCYVGGVSDATYAVTCPHCQRDFEAELLEGSAERHRGFKCPHCRLFVPLERADADEGEPVGEPVPTIHR
jgi:hypothetical protein